MTSGNSYSYLILFLLVILGICIYFRKKIRDKDQEIQSLQDTVYKLNSSVNDACAEAVNAKREKIHCEQEMTDEIQQERALSQQRLEELEDLRDAVSAFASERIGSDIDARLSHVGWGVKLDASKDFADALRKANDEAESMVDYGRAVVSSTGGWVPQESAALVLDAFNGYARFYIYSSNHSYERRIQYLRLAYFMINRRAEASLHVSISKEYLDKQLTVLAIKNQMEEYKRSKRAEDQSTERFEEFKSAESKKIARELDKLRNRLMTAHNQEKAKLQEQINLLQRELEENQRSISNAQMTKRGTVYVISNIGSFGENVYKIGMTRRTDPQERIDELSVASVPFAFDVHAFINTDDAPKLENELHKRFQASKINSAALQGREFYRVPITQIRQCVESLGYFTKWSMSPEAEEYRLSKGLPLKETTSLEAESTKKNVVAEIKPKVDPKKEQDERTFLRNIESAGIKYVDKRNVGGCLWVESTPRADQMIKNVVISGKRFMLAKRTKTFGGNPGWFLS